MEQDIVNWIIMGQQIVIFLHCGRSNISCKLIIDLIIVVMQRNALRVLNRLLMVKEDKRR